MTTPNSLLPPFRALSMSDPATPNLLGSLFGFVGTWTSAPKQGWNLISVPGPKNDKSYSPMFYDASGFFLETIPYLERTTFRPITVLNRGEFIAGDQQVQRIGALLYEQRITSAALKDVLVESDDPAKYHDIQEFLTSREFLPSTLIHAEQGMLLNLTNLASSEVNIARLGTIPHGNAVLCLGTSKQEVRPVFDSAAETRFSAGPTAIPPSVLPGDYDAYLPYGLAGNFDVKTLPFDLLFWPSRPLKPLADAANALNIASTQHISLSSKSGTGGILNIPFVAGGRAGTPTPLINTTDMVVDYWLSSLKDVSGSDALRLQYAQKINLVFPATNDPQKPIIWPHLGLNTLYKISDEA